MSNDPSRSNERRISTDRDTIREWSDQHEAVPVRHRTDEDLRLVREDQMTDDYERVEWDDFHRQLDEDEYAVFYHGEEADEPFEITGHDTAAERAGIEREELQNQLLEGEVVTTQISETTVVETVVVEEATLESELVDTEIVDEEVVDVELLDRSCNNCELVETGELADDEWFDTDRFIGSARQAGRTRTTGSTVSPEIGGETDETTDTTDTTTTTDLERTGIEREFPYTAEMDVEESWMVSREITERYTVESRISDTDVTEADTIEDHDIDVEGLQRSIVEQGLIGQAEERDPDEILSQCQIQTEYREGDKVHTQFTRSRLVEDEVVDEMRVYADVTSADVRAMDVAYTEDIDTEMTETTGTTETVETTETETSDVESMGTESTGRTAQSLSEGDVGKKVVDATGATVGEVTRVADDGHEMYVDAHSGIAERIKSALNWGDRDEEDYAIYASQVETVTDDEIRLKGHEELGDRDHER